jgi:hypothetical protein
MDSSHVERIGWGWFIYIVIKDLWEISSDEEIIW